MLTLFTIGRPTHPLALFVRILLTNGVRRLIDMRAIPRSRRSPRYGQSARLFSMPGNGTEHLPLKAWGSRLACPGEKADG